MPWITGRQLAPQESWLSWSSFPPMGGFRSERHLRQWQLMVEVDGGTHCLDSPGPELCDSLESLFLSPLPNLSCGLVLWS